MIGTFTQSPTPWYRPRSRGTTENGTASRSLEPSDHFLFYSILPHRVPEHLYSTMALFLHRANHGLNIGNFEFDLSQGEIRFKTSVQAKSDQFPHAPFQSLVHHNVLVVDEYMPGILSIISDSMSAEAAIMMIESPAVGDA